MMTPRAYPKIISEAPEKSGVEAFARIFPVPLRNFGICTKWLIRNIPNLEEDESRKLFERLKALYDGYAFNESYERTLFNPTMIFFYLRKYL
ncbi:MAG: AAA family ATPase, partial [Clostridiales bacterium]|nr:AAA family ATPase [Clostridiales bacterium]